ncbi:amino acid permease [Salinibacterium hongtaonis]|uniref:Amino acid permease n=1 Tax=Homoserinimonas hongtaonis TaxID=2079791 RepID=A0A2U1T0V8_9MICO|nr:amino acid permease [Salinibacterium hongtaonis]AWB90060.1 amino acid:proton antiporter [Salinibacterium hongtaonis]PWB97515.1 amino acid permease [Salinibacterium hongtaonis]
MSTESSHSKKPTRADGTAAPSEEHVAPHPFKKVKHRPAIGAPATTATTFMTVWQLAILTVVAVASLRSLPAMAGYGLGSITLFIIPAIFFLVPTALVAAELATGWKGGVFTWVREAFGPRWGFQAIWLQWVQNVVWYPTQIAFIAASLAFVFLDPKLADSGAYTAIVIVVLYWGSTLITLRGGNLFAKVGSWSGLIGTILPGLLLIIFAFVWIGSGRHSEISLEASSIIPPFTGIASIVLIVSNVLAYAGMEVNAVHANDLKNPGKGFPRSVLIASVLILGLFIIPTIAIGLVVPSKQLGLTTGINLAFQNYFEAFGVSWLTPVLSLLIALGAFASVVTWIAGPSRGLLAAARSGYLPAFLQRRNKAGVQSGILIPQGIIVTLLASLFLFIPNINTAFIALIDMAAALYLIMYMLMFAAAMKLRKSQPNVKRTYRTPGMFVIATVGFIACFAAFCLGFIPPDNFAGGAPGWVYPVLVGVVVIALGVPPLIFYAVRKPSWDQRTPEEVRTFNDVLVNPEESGAGPDAPPQSPGGSAPGGTAPGGETSRK